MDKTVGPRNGGEADSPISVLEDELTSVGCEVPFTGDDIVMPLNFESGEVLLITDDMAEEEKRLEEARVKVEDAGNKILMKNEAPKVDDSKSSKLDDLLNQTQLYSEFLLEKMDDITYNASVNNNAQMTKGNKKGKPGKRKAAANRNAARKKARVAVEAMLASCKEEKQDEGSDKLTEEERLWKEQMELVPLLTGGRLKAYQIKGVKWMISLWQNGLNGILINQMGLGKTVQTIGLLAHLKGMGMHGPFFVVAPLSTLSNWVNEFNRFVPSMNVLLYHGSKDVRAELRRQHMTMSVGPTFPVIITSYEVAMNDRKPFAQYKWKYLVVDEGHRLKNFQCKLLRELKLLNVENTLLLTGTPLHNNLAELWSLLNFILPQVFTSLDKFQSWFDFSGKQMNGMQQEFDEKKRVQVISKLHSILRPFLLRRLKEDVEKNLPLKKEIILYARMTEHQKDIQDHLINKTLVPYLHEKAEYGTAVKSTLDNLMIQLRKNFNHPDLLYHYPPVHKLMEQCGKFQLLDRLLKHLKARLCVGDAIFCNPQMDLQAMDRCHRIGQTRPVHVYRLCTAHSVECRMLKVAFGKLKLEHVVIEKGQFCQERTNSNIVKESDLLALLQQERDEEEEFVQSEEISEPNLLRLLDRIQLKILKTNQMLFL